MSLYQIEKEQVMKYSNNELRTRFKYKQEELRSSKNELRTRFRSK